MPQPFIILVVDDDEASRNLMHDVLDQDAYRLVFAANGEEALALAEEHQPDLILLDIVLPGIDGYEVCQRIRELPTVAQIPVVMLTGYDSNKAAQMAIDAGADDFINKPYNVAEMRLRVKTITKLDQYRKLRAERDRFEWVVDKNLDGYVGLDSNCRINFLNAQAKKYLGISGDDYLAEKLHFYKIAEKKFLFYHPSAWVRWPNLPDNAYLVRPESEDTGACWLKVEKFDSTSGDGGSLLRLHDESLQIHLRQNIWTFESMMMHKVRAPLDKTLELIKKVDKEAETSGNGEVILLTRKAMNAALELNETVSDILEQIHRPDSGALRYRRIVQMTNERLPEIEKDVGLEYPVFVRMDDGLDGLRVVIPEHHFVTILEELCENSRKFHPKRSPRIEISVSRKNDHTIAFDFIDDGRNVPEYALDLISAPYFQEDRSQSGEVPGVGLGLTRVSSMLSNYGGALSVRNRAEKPGLVVSLEMPVKNGALPDE